MKRLSRIAALFFPDRSSSESFAGVLGARELTQRLKSSTPNRRLVVTPLLEPHVEGGSIDLRLGTKFIILQRSAVETIDPLEITPNEASRLQSREELAFGQPYVLHPGHLILASTFEYIGLPPDLCAYVITRSSYGRIGLMTATAVFVHPRFRGCLTLEMFNYGDAPIKLYPGTRVAQLVFHRCAPSPAPESPKYQLCTAPEFPHLDEDNDRHVLRGFRTAFDPSSSHALSAATNEPA